MQFPIWNGMSSLTSTSQPPCTAQYRNKNSENAHYFIKFIIFSHLFRLFPFYCEDIVRKLIPFHIGNKKKPFQTSTTQPRCITQYRNKNLTKCTYFNNFLIFVYVIPILLWKDSWQMHLFKIPNMEWLNFLTSTNQPPCGTYCNIEIKIQRVKNKQRPH